MGLLDKFSVWSGVAASNVNDEKLYPQELYRAGVRTPKGNKRYRKGFGRSDLSSAEKAKLNAYRRKILGD